MLASAEAEHEFVPGPRRSFRLASEATSHLVALTSLVLLDTDVTHDESWSDVDVEVDLLPLIEPIEQARAVLHEIVRLGQVDVAKFPRSAVLRANLARSLVAVGDLASAEAEAQTAVDLDSAGGHLALLGSILAANDHLDEAWSTFHTVLIQDPDNLDALQGVAEILVRQSRFEEAVPVWRHVDELLPHSAIPPFNLGLLSLARRNRGGEAIAFFKRSVRRAPRWAPGHHALGVAYSVQGRPDRAATAFRVAATLDPGMVEAVNGLATALRQSGRVDDAAGELVQGIGRHPSDFRLRELLADIYVDRKHYRRAQSELHAALQAIQSDPDSVPAATKARIANNLGVCYVHEKAWMEAENLFIRAQEFDESRRTTPGNNLGLLRVERGDVAGARSVLGDLVEMGQGSEDTYLILSQSYFRERDYESAARYLSDAIRDERAGARTYATLGAILTDSVGDVERAREVLAAGLRAYPEDDLLHNNLAYACLIDGSIDPARTLLETVSNRPLEPGIRALVTATWGLLAIREGRLVDGAARYDEASRIASSTGATVLAREVRQKKHLELARARIRAGDATAAAVEVEAGLAVRGRHSYRRDLEALALALGIPIPEGPSRSDRRARSRVGRLPPPAM
jgi:tetratricopeptide (TPR) repeat protein